MTNEELFSKSRSEWERLIDEWVIGRNAERDRAILKRRLLDGVTLESLAEEFDLSVQRIKIIIYNSQNRIIKHI
jgi:DNA-directed RNA polymerase sigma subunit (sigma70/sigma32)